ncbi:hypothetical protein [Streptomyces sp. NBC_00996]|uniref:hypothetical protein n=1 Tax=Streptomyces sp. NBC_00996 TaxID=2903710 RepID=UPI0038684964|nr:hypothetical protein OG390_40935 [Streptomyces sp. NBC_00996]
MVHLAREPVDRSVIRQPGHFVERFAEHAVDMPVDVDALQERLVEEAGADTVKHAEPP